MEQQKNIAEIQRKFTVEIDARTLNRITPFDRNELTTAYMKLFSGFAWVNWATGHSLGRAWQTALTQAGTFCEAKNKQNPAAKYLSATYRGHKKYWSRVIMTHPGRDGRGDPADSRMALYREHGMRMIRAAMSQINLILARYNEHTLSVSRADANQSAAPAPAPAPQAAAQQPAPAPAPQAAAQQPAQRHTARQVSAVVEPQPAIAKPQPAIAKSQPAIAKQQPAIVKQQPAIVKPEPAIVKSQPAIAKPQPAIAKQQPAIVKSQPAIAKQQPAIAAGVRHVQPARRPYVPPRVDFVAATERVNARIEQINAARAGFMFRTQIRMFTINNAMQNNIGRAA